MTQPRVDAFSMHKSVRIQWATPYVKGSPVTMHNCDNANENRCLLEMKEIYSLHALVTPFKRQLLMRSKVLRSQESLIMKAAATN